MDINLDTINVSQSVIKMIGDIDLFNGRWPLLKQKIEFNLGNLKHISTIASIGSSTRIEGVSLSDEDIDRFLDHIDKDSFLSRDQQEVLGYKDIVTHIFDSYDDIDISENAIKHLHKILLSFSDKDDFHLGNYKKFDNNVTAQHSGKTVGIIFKTATPFETPEKMRHLLAWYSKNEPIHALVKCAVFIVHFLAIHPFQDGNGRLSRALTTLIMLKHGYHYVPYCSLESVIEANKSEYYKALRKTQMSLTTQPDYEPWFSFFFTCLLKQQAILANKEAQLKPALNKNQKKLLAFAETVHVFQNSEASEHLKMNKNTVKLNLKKLCDLNLLKKEGTGKGTWYRRF